MKARKLVSMLMLCIMLISVVTACGGNSGATPSPSPAPTNNGGATEATPSEEATEGDALSQKLEEYGLDENLRFKETRKISVEVYERNNDGGSDPTDNFYTDFIKEGMLRDHNVEVTFIPVPRWTETEEINNLLAAGQAPDVCLTYSYATALTYAKMGGVHDLNQYIGEKELYPNLWDLLGSQNINWNKEPKNETIWAIEALLKHNWRINTFVREDWLKKLNIAEPTTLEEFESMLYAFRDNAETLLGADADKIIPFGLSFDVGWRANYMLNSFVPNDFSDKDYYITNFDDRGLLRPGFKEGLRKLNEWYNNDLVWKDFALYGPGDQTEDNYARAGYTGSFMHNWDYPYRDGENGIQGNLNRLEGQDARFIPVDPFPNDAGVYKKYLSGPIDRKIFFPSTNKEPIASMLYLDWISTLENRKFLQIGEEGVTHETLPNGAVKTIPATDNKIMNSTYNVDYTMTLNGFDLGDNDLNVESIANGFAGLIDSSYIAKAYEYTMRDARIDKNVNVGEILAEQGMGPALVEKRNVLLDNAVVATPDKFDAVFDSGLQDYLSSGGQAIIDERIQKFEEFFGSATMLP